MQDWLQRYLSPDDLWSVLGYVAFIVVSRLNSPPPALSLVSLLASGMLAIFWLASQNVRARNSERNPNARVAVWAMIAVTSAYVATLG